MPEGEEAEKAGDPTQQLPEPVNLTQRTKLLRSPPYTVHVDCNEDRRIVAVKPKPAVRPLFRVATMKKESGVVFYNEKAPTLSGSSIQSRSCFLVETGEGRTPRPKGPLVEYTTSLSGVLILALRSFRRHNLRSASR